MADQDPLANLGTPAIAAAAPADPLASLGTPAFAPAPAAAASVGAHAGGLASQRNAQAQPGITPETRANPNPVTGQPQNLLGIAWLGKAAQKIQELKDMTQDEKVQHPVKAALGAAINELEGYLTGNEGHLEHAIGTGKYGMLNNPVTAALIPGGEGGSIAAEATEAGGQAAEEGAQAAGSAVKSGAQSTVNAAKQAPAAVRSGLVNPFKKAANAFTGADIQPVLKNNIREVWNAVAADAGVPKPSASSVQDLGQEVGDAILARSKANYKLIDGATGGRFAGTESDLKSVNRALQSVTNDVEEQALLVRKTRLEMQMNQMMDEAEATGVPKSTVDAAKNDFKQAQAIYDTNHQIRMSTTGVRPGMPGAAAVPEEVNAKTMMNRLNKLYNKGRLQQAVGDDSAADLIGHSAAAQKAARTVSRNRKIAAIAAPVAATGIGTAYELTK